MKTLLRLFGFAAGLALVSPAFSATTPVVGTDTEKAAQALAEEIKDTPYKERGTLRVRLETAQTRFDAKLPEWEARKNALPEQERQAAEVYFKELVKQRDLLRQRVDALTLASEETWTSVKHDTRLALLNALGAYQQLRARFDQ